MTEVATTKASTPDRQVVHDEKPDAASKARFMPDPKKPYAHPYHWAPFILIGNLEVIDECNVRESGGRPTIPGSTAQRAIEKLDGVGVMVRVMARFRLLRRM